MKKKSTIILLAAGSGKRMQSQVPKQFMELCGKPLICHCLDTIEKSEIIDECVLVTSKNDMEYMQEHVLAPYGYRKVVLCCVGGHERYASVYEGIKALRTLRGQENIGNDEILYIQDGARPFLDEKIIEDTYQAADAYGACVAAVLAKDTVKIGDENGFAINTPNRKNVWLVQTPQVFKWELISNAYDLLDAYLKKYGENSLAITDDACVVETMLKKEVKLVEASYKNIKITTPEDIAVAMSFMNDKS